LALPNGIPSHDTFGRGFAALDATQFQAHFVRWVQAIWPAELGEVISVDGKTVAITDRERPVVTDLIFCG
jgi:hypothetical protein